MDKPKLYYSNNCQYSKEILKCINTKNISDNFQTISIEETKDQLPKYVDRVPLLFYNNKVLYDEGLFLYINSLNSKQEEVNAFTIEKTLSDTFSYIDSGDAMNHNYLKINEKGSFEDQKIDTPQDSSDDSKKLDLETLMNERKKEQNV